jgi:DNA-binding CsgD family transcriptional regulator
MQRGEGRPAWRSSQARVTARESEILSWVAAGKSDWAIGRILNISGKTVNFHVENAKRKLGAGTRIQAVVAAMRSGIIGQWASQAVIFAEFLTMLA